VIGAQAVYPGVEIFFRHNLVGCGGCDRFVDLLAFAG